MKTNIRAPRTAGLLAGDGAGATAGGFDPGFSCFIICLGLFFVN
jgi:hypothetical protein